MHWIDHRGAQSQWCKAYFGIGKDSIINGCHFTADIFKPIFLNGDIRIAIWISLKFVHKGQIGNKSASFQAMAWHQQGGKPLPEPMLTQFTDTYMRYLVEMG